MWIELVFFRFVVSSSRFGLWLWNITREFSHQVLQIFFLDLWHVSNQRHGSSVCFQWLLFWSACKIGLLVEDIWSDDLHVQVQCFVLGVHVPIFSLDVVHRKGQIELPVMFLIDIEPEVPVALPHRREMRMRLSTCPLISSPGLLLFLLLLLRPESICAPRSHE